MNLAGICFFYRSKCNGFRVAFEFHEPIHDLETYEKHHDAKVRLVRGCTPDGELSNAAWFHIDGVGRRGQAYWSYPRVHNPVWLNPNRTIL